MVSINLLKDAAKEPDKEILMNNDSRLGESLSCSFNDIKKLFPSAYTDEELIELLTEENYDIVENNIGDMHMKAETKKTVTKAEKKEIKHDIVKDWDIVAHVVKVTPQGFDWFGETCIAESLFINKYGSCIGCICVCVGCGTIRVMDPTLYSEFIGNGGQGW